VGVRTITWTGLCRKSKAATVNRHGGNATVLQLPKSGMTGSTHFAFPDLNNVHAADHLSAWLKEKKPD
jgi:hypothetical protein